MCRFDSWSKWILIFIHIFCQIYAGSQQKFDPSALKFDLKLFELNLLSKVLKSKAFKNLSKTFEKPRQNNHQKIHQNTCKIIHQESWQKVIKKIVKRKILGPETKIISCYSLSSLKANLPISVPRSPNCSTRGQWA